MHLARLEGINITNWCVLMYQLYPTAKSSPESSPLSRTYSHSCRTHCCVLWDRVGPALETACSHWTITRAVRDSAGRSLYSMSKIFKSVYREIQVHHIMSSVPEKLLFLWNLSKIGPVSSLFLLRGLITTTEALWLKMDESSQVDCVLPLQVWLETYDRQLS